MHHDKQNGHVPPVALLDECAPERATPHENGCAEPAPGQVSPIRIGHKRALAPFSAERPGRWPDVLQTENGTVLFRIPVATERGPRR